MDQTLVEWYRVKFISVFLKHKLYPPYGYPYADKLTACHCGKVVGGLFLQPDEKVIDAGAAYRHFKPGIRVGNNLQASSGLLDNALD